MWWWHIPTTPPHSPQDHHCHERTTRTRAEKHALTPESKAASESKPKRFAGLLIYVHDNTISFKQIDHWGQEGLLRWHKWIFKLISIMKVVYDSITVDFK